MFIKIIITFIIVFIALGCQPTQSAYEKKPIKFIIPKSFTKKEVFDLMIKSLANLKWIVEDTHEGNIIARLNHRNYKAKVTLKYNDEEIVILNHSLASVEMYYEKGIMKRKDVEAVPYNWLINIKKELEKEASKTSSAKLLSK